jgi:hypothetical protein
MIRPLLSVALSLVILVIAAPLSAEPAAPTTEDTEALTWHDDYGHAYDLAKKEGKMLLINFVPTGSNGWQQELERAIAANPAWQEKLRRVVLLRLPQGAQITSGGNSVRLLSHPSFGEMHGQSGLAVLDLAHPKMPYYGGVVSAFPFTTSKYYRWRTDYLPVILELPAGTITQRTMVWAVRVHPERPASTTGAMDGRLAGAAQQHCEYQARIGVQGHHRWEGRFHRLRALLGRGAPVEIVAESWPGQNMIDSCVDCVASWRHSSGHWNAVRTAHSVYGYDIRRGNNGIWYGTGIFASY